MTAEIHWFTGVTELDVDEVLDLVNDAAGGYGFEVLGQKWFYGTRYRSAEGLEVLVDPLRPGMPPVCVNVPGAACEWLGAGGVQRVASICKPTHVDFAWTGVPFTVREFDSWLVAGNARTRARTAERFGPIWAAKGQGNTVRLGTQGASWMLRVYDRRGPVRAELRLMGERAEAAYDLVMSDPSEWSRGFMGILRGLVDMVDRTPGGRADRSPLLPSWEAFVRGAERLVVKLACRVSDSFERADRWLHSQVARTLWAYQKAGGSVGAVLRYGARIARISDHRKAAVWRDAVAVGVPSG